MDSRFVSPLKDLVHQLVSHDFQRIAEDGRIGSLTIEQVVTALESYHATLVEVPDEAFRLATVRERGGREFRWLVHLPLWTEEEGRSDLTLSVEIGDDGGSLQIRMRDLHVL